MREGLLAGGAGAADGDSAGEVSSGRRPRVYYIDWMRVIAIYLVVVYHVVQGLDWVHFYSNVPGMSKFVVSFRASALQIGMPMFFHISGRAHGLSASMGLVQTFVRRAQRLLLPFAVCYALLIPPWQFIDKEYDWEHPGSLHMKANPITWLVDYWARAKFLIYFDLAWLWFLPALWLIIFFATPLFLLGERFNADLWHRTYYAVAALLWAGLALFLVAIGFSERFAFFAVLGPTSAVAVARFVPVPAHERSRSGLPPPPAPGAPGARPSALRMWVASHVCTLVQIVASVGVVLNFGYAEIDPPRPDGGHDPRAAVPFILLCLSFYVHGFFMQRWSEGSDSIGSTDELWWIWPYRILAFFVVLLMTMVSSPLGDVESGHFIYPIYSASYKDGAGFGAIYVLGTWTSIWVFSSLFEAYCNKLGSASFHKHATGSTIVVYIFHWVFVKVFAFWWLNPTLWTHHWIIRSAWVAMLITILAFVTSVSLSLCIYAYLVACAPRLGTLFGLEGAPRPRPRPRGAAAVAPAAASCA